MRNGRAFLYAMLLAMAILWGLAFTAIKEVLGEVSFTTLTLLRFAVAAVLLLVIAAVRPALRPRVPTGDWGRILILGVTGVPAYHLALNWGEQRAAASVAALLIATAPVMIAIASAIVLRERVTVRRAAGIALAFGGVALLALTSERTGEHGTTIAGVLVTAIAPLSWAVYTIAARPLTQRMPATQITIASMLAGSAMLLPLVRAETFREAAAMSAAGWAWMILLGAGSSVAGYLIFNWALGKMEATQVAVAIYMVPVIAIVAAALILGEPLGPWIAVAAVLVIGGVVLAQRPSRRARYDTATPTAVPTK